MDNSYCSQKFTWLSVQPGRREMASCCSGSPCKVDLTWLSQHPGQLFNSPELQQDRAQMLNGQRPESCRAMCWNAEDAGLQSKRLLTKSNIVTHTDINAALTHLNITLSTDCNLTCVYCTKQFSTAWLDDINKNGPYLPDTDDDRDKLNTYDRVKLKLSQPAIKMTPQYTAIIDEVTQYQSLQTIQLSGGEPFLFNGLEDIVAKFGDREVQIFSGLGVNSQRLERILTLLPKSVTIVISAETTGALYEFIRYGHSYEDFLKNLSIIERMGFKFKFASVVSNLTIHGFNEFQQKFGTSDNYINTCADPDYLGLNVLDDDSKQLVRSTAYKYHDQEVKAAVDIGYTELQKEHLSTYLKEFARRRQLSLSVFPESFTEWLYGKSNS